MPLRTDTFFTWRKLLILPLLGWASGITAQSGCSISVGPDVTICQGQTTTLFGPPGWSNYLWSTGAATQNITVGTAGSYWCEVGYPSGQLVTNGNFDAGNTGFTTQFNYNNNLQVDGSYFIGFNAGTYHPFFVGWGAGLFLMVNGGVAQSGWDIWCQTVPVCPGQTYTLGFDLASLVSQNPPRVRWRINGVLTGPTFIPPAGPNVWINCLTNWTAPPGVTSANICLELTSSFAVGNDLGIDNISMSGNVVLRDTLQVNVTPLPPVNLGPDQVLCAGTPVVLDATVPGGTYLWQDGSTNPTYNVSGSGNYSVTVTANNCNASDAALITFNPYPVVNLGNDTTICAGQSVVLSVPNIPGSAFLWQDGSTGPSLTASTSGLYSVSVTRNGCTTTDVINVTVNPLPVIDLGNDTAVCAGQPVVLDATVPGATYLWQDGSTNPTLNANATGNYTVTATLNGCSVTDAINVTVDPLPTVDLGNDTTLCAGQPLVLDATYPGATYLWQNGSSTPTFNAAAGGSFSVTVDLNGCTATDAISVSVNPLPVVDLGNDTAICAGQPLVLDATVPGATYLWQDGSINPTLNAYTTGNYTVTATLNGCSASDAISVTVDPLPTVELGNDTTICAGQPLVLDATYPGATYLWQNGSTTPTFNAGAGGGFSVTVDLNGCTATDGINVSVNPLPVVELGNDTSICAGQPLQLDATVPGATYLWQDGSTNPTLNASATGNYSVTATLNGCITSDAINVTVAPLPTVDLGNDTTLCAGQPLVLDATYPGATYLWQNGSAASTINAASGGNFSVTVDLNGCTATDAINVAVNPLPVVDLGNDTIVCPGVAVTFQATTPGASYLWQDGSSASSFTTAAPGNVSVVVTVGGCSASDAVTLSNFNLQSVNLGPDVVACAGTPVPLGVTVPGATYLWNTGATTSSINASTSGTYWQRTTLNGCQVSDTVLVTFTPLPVVDLGNDTTVCPGDQVLLDATTAGASYLWSSGAATPTLSAGAGNWSVQVTVNGCTGTDAITIGTLTPPVVSLGNDTTLCPGASLTLSAAYPGASQLWQNGATTPTFTVTAAGTYSVTVTAANTCTAADAINVAYASPVPVDLGNDTTICAGSTLVLNATTPAATYVWSTGASTPTLTVSAAGNYTVSVLQGACTVSDAIVVAVAAAPVVALGNDTTLCPGAALVLDATTAGADYLWQDGSTTPTITAAATGTYSVTVTDANGCTGTDAINVLMASPNAVDLGPDQTICQGTTVVLDATLPGSTYLWNNGATSPTLSVNASGVYAVEVFQGACSVVDTVAITVLPVPLVDLGNDTTLCPGGSVVLDATWPTATYLWSTGTTAPTELVASTGTVWVNVSAGGCSASDTVQVNVLGALVLDLGNDTTLCPGASITLSAQLPGGLTTWSTGATGPSLLASQSGAYWAEVNVGGCTVSDTINVAYTPLNGMNLGADIGLCAGASVQLAATVTPGATYLWDDGSVAATRTVSASGTYWAEAALAGCGTRDTIVVTMVPLPVFSLGNDTALCPGNTVMLDATTPGASYAWNNGTAGASTTVGPGTWSVLVTVNGCSASDTLVVGTLPVPVADLGNDTTLCDGAMLVLNVAQAGASYLWQNGSTAPQQAVTQAGSYSVTVDLDGCTASDAINVAVFSPASIDLGPDTTLCPGNTISWSFNLPGAGYLWSDGSTSGQYSTGTAGTVWLEAGAPGCMVYDTVLVGIVPLPLPDLGDDLVACDGDTVTLAVNAGPATAQWSTGASTNAIAITDQGTYSVTLSLDGCSATDAVTVTILPVVEELPLADMASLCPGEALHLDATVPYTTVLWSTGSTDPVLLVQETGVYVVAVTGPCTALTDTVWVNEGGCAPFIHVPNTFTPNGDGFNEVFAPVIEGGFERYELLIFDRWGERIFTSDQPGQAWDGTLNGTPVQDGVYVWTLRYKALTKNGVERQQLMGHVTLLR
ncbi:MAG: gliding motility-associated C-terminal domain-containing protein [Flavobacteriales bacterium]|nr:gliding motility-associated C-terminal domain-containing protein [Flavobacteriales bacterium]